MNDTVVIRPGVRADLPQIVLIYNHYVVNTHITFDLEAVKLEDRVAWFEDFSTREQYQLWVAEADQVVVGYAHSRAFRPKAAYATSVETTIYMAPDYGVRGVGSKLYQALFTALEKVDVHRAYCAISLPNDVSIGLHLKIGFEPLYTQSEVGRKFGRYYDVRWFEKKF